MSTSSSGHRLAGVQDVAACAILAWTVIILIAANTAEADQSASALVMEAADSFARIRSIEYRTTRSLSAVPPAPVVNAPRDSGQESVQLEAEGPEQVRQLGGEYTYRMNGSRYRVDYGDGTVQRISTFNGEKFQNISHPHSVYVENTLPPQAGTPCVPFPCPIMRSYDWAVPSSAPHHIKALTERQHWEEVSHTAAMLQTDPPMIEVTRASFGKEFAYALEFGRENDILVLKRWTSYSLPDRNKTGSLEVSQFHTVLSDDGTPVCLPVEAIFEYGDVSGFVSIDPASLRLNHAIDEDVFTLSTSGMKIVQRETRKPKEKKVLDDARRAQGDDAHMSPLVWVNIVALLAIGGYWIWRWIKARRPDEAQRSE